MTMTEETPAVSVTVPAEVLLEMAKAASAVAEKAKTWPKLSCAWLTFVPAKEVLAIAATDVHVAVKASTGGAGSEFGEKVEHVAVLAKALEAAVKNVAAGALDVEVSIAERHVLLAGRNWAGERIGLARVDREIGLERPQLEGVLAAGRAIEGGDGIDRWSVEQGELAKLAKLGGRTTWALRVMGMSPRLVGSWTSDSGVYYEAAVALRPEGTA